MIRVDCEQGSAEWFEARLGIPTASAFKKIITAKTGKLSSAADGYAHQLIAERILGMQLEQESFGFMERGKLQEQAARSFYELKRDVDVELVGFCLRDDKRAGCSPDGLIGLDGLLEIKVPNAANHIGYLLADNGVGEEYRPQVQGQLWVCEREWLDTVSYNPELPNALVRTPRDEAYIKALEAAVKQFCDFIDEQMLKLVQRGHLDKAALAELPSLRVA